MKTILTPALTFVVALGLSLPLGAHHSAAAFNTQQETKTTGTVTAYRFANPHVYITLEVTRADGSKGVVEIEAGAASVLNGLGFTRNAIAVGDLVTVVGNPGRREPEKLMLGRDLFKRDGTYFPLNISSRSVAATGADTATSIAGTWFSPMREFTGFLGSARSWSVTDKGKAAIAAGADPKLTTQKDCIPIGAPAVMFYPVANTITVQKDRVVMKVDWMASERTIFLDGRAHPPASQTFLHGHSTGRWEGDTLVVETTNFQEHSMGNSTTLPGSTQKRLVERFRLGDDKKSLVYSGVIEDPVYLAKPVEWTGQWQYRPTLQHSNEACNVEIARRFLSDF
jgi:hypothetical protein